MMYLLAPQEIKKRHFLQQPSGTFINSIQPVLVNDSIYEDVSACWVDMNNDGNIDLVVANGGNEFYGQDEHNTPRIYLNDGKANFTRLFNPLTVYTSQLHAWCQTILMKMVLWIYLLVQGLFPGSTVRFHNAFVTNLHLTSLLHIN